MPASERNVGGNYLLAFRMDDDPDSKVHMTLLYINNVKRGYEQERVKALATELMDEMNLPETVSLEYTQMDGAKSKDGRLTERCVSVANDALAAFQLRLYEVLCENKLDCRPPVPLHVDLRGGSDAQLPRVLPTRNNWYY